MKTTKMLFFVFVIFMSVASCRSIKVLPSSKTNTTERTVTKTRTETIDTLQVVREADTAKVAVKVTKLTDKPVKVKSKHATVTVRKVNGQVEADCKCDGLEAQIELLKEIIETYKETETNTENNTVVRESWWVPWLKPFTPFVVIGIILFLYKKGFFNFKKNEQ